MHLENYDVIIVGGGPTGIALGIELGLNNINTLILEKYSTPLLSPRAQLLNARSMEFFMRWGLDHIFKDRQVLSFDFPNQGVWCSKLNGQTYAISSSNSLLNDTLSPQRNIRLPLWITEDILRNKLKELASVKFLKEHEVLDVVQVQDQITVTSKNNNRSFDFKASYVVGCDGTGSLVREKAGIQFESLAKTKRVISIVFEVFEFEKYITVEKGGLFFLLENRFPAAIGSIDPVRGLWYAQIIYDGEFDSIDEIDINGLIDEAAGITFPKKILKAHFWDMQIQLAKNFSKKNCIFLVGDSAHGFVPTGALGLNTGLGDVINLAWKLSAVIQKKIDPSILSTYEQERLPICVRNLKLSQKNADDMTELKARCNPNVDLKGFAKANADLAKQFTNALGVIMGYAYFYSPLTYLSENQSINLTPEASYQPTAEPGYFLPHIWIAEKQSIYCLLSATHWTLLISSEDDSDLVHPWIKQLKKNLAYLDILILPKDSYEFKYILVRPDWHITFSTNELEVGHIKLLRNFNLITKVGDLNDWISKSVVENDQ